MILHCRTFSKSVSTGVNPCLRTFASSCLCSQSAIYKSAYFMQNKPNPKKTKTNLNSVPTKDYKNKPPRPTRKNKPNQTQFPFPEHQDKSRRSRDRSKVPAHVGDARRDPIPPSPKAPIFPNHPQPKPNPSAVDSFVSPFPHPPIESYAKTEFHKISIESNLQPAANKTHTHAGRRAFIPCLCSNLEYNVGTQYSAVSQNKWILQFRRHRTGRAFGAKSRGGIRREV